MSSEEKKQEQEEKNFNKLIDRLKEKNSVYWTEEDKTLYRIAKLQYIHAGWKSNQYDGTMGCIFIFGIIITVLLCFINTNICSILNK